MSLTFVEVGHFAMPSSFTGSMVSCPGQTIIPRYSTSVAAKVYFSNFK